MTEQRAGLSAPAPITAPAKLSMIGARAFLLEAPGAFDLAAQRRIWALSAALRLWPETAEVIPGMTNVLLVLARTAPDPEAIRERLLAAWDRVQPLSREGRLIEIAVHYGGEKAIDLGTICDHAGLPAAEVIRRHHARDYMVFALGSAPGFGYLFGLDRAIYTPRKTVPSVQMLRGTVTIGGMQSGVSALTGPNGWNALGFAEIDVFDPQAAQPAVMAPGDRVRFLPERIEL